MKIVVLGGTGLTGQCAVRDLVESRGVSEVVIAARNTDKAKQVADKIKSKKVSVASADASKPKEMVAVLRGSDVVINAVQYYFNIDVMKAALAARVHYLDLGGLFHITRKQLKLNEKFRKAGLTALLGMGAMPGVTNILARYLVDKLDSVETILIRDGWRDFTKGAPPFVVTWSLPTLMDEMTLNAIIFENGRFREVPPLSLKETVDFPDPVGTTDVYTTIHSEVATLPISFKEKGVKNVNWKEGGPGFLQNKLLVDMGVADTEPIKLKNTEIVPRDFLMAVLTEKKLLGYPEGVIPDDYEATRVQVIGEKKKQKVVYTMDVVFQAKKEWGASCSQYDVGVPASIAAQMIAKGEISARGALPPEVCVNPRPFVAQLTRRNIKVYETSMRLLS